MQVIALMVLSLAHLLFLRFIEPMCERGELVVALVGEVCDAGVFVCGLILIIGDSVNDKFRSVAAVIYGDVNLSIFCSRGGGRVGGVDGGGGM